MFYHYIDPVQDADAYMAYKETEKAIWEESCVKCELCEKAIDPHEDSNCLSFGDSYIHIKCFSEAIKKTNLPDFLKDWTIEAVEESSYDSTPEPEN